MTRSQFNHRIRALAHGSCGLDEENYRTVVESVTGKRHITQCDDEEANLVFLALKKMRDNVGRASSSTINPDQHRMIAKLGYILKWDWNDIAHFTAREVHKQSTKACNAAELSKVIRGMIGVIDYKLKCGMIGMDETQRFNYERHARRHRNGNGLGAEARRAQAAASNLPSQPKGVQP
jgi:hypothetical protein